MWLILLLGFVVYVVYSLIVIRAELKSIKEHLNIRDTLKFTEEEIEKQKGNELFEELNK